MFSEESRYSTRGIIDEVPIDIQMLLWNEIDNLKKSTNKLDYLQVFKISIIDEEIVEIQHSQEVPEYKKTIIVKSKDINRDIKIFVIDEVSHSTMLLAEEY